ncbi:MAG: hypothetical protein ABI333_13620 [bacterium]
MAKTKLVAPTRFELYQLLLAHQALPLSRAKHCEGVVAPKLREGPTLGDWVAYNLSLLHGGKVRLPRRCKRVGATPSAAVWECDLEFSVVNPSTKLFWTWGVRLRVRNSTRELVPGSVMCIGAG